jgi:hypothetical protein
MGQGADDVVLNEGELLRSMTDLRRTSRAKLGIRVGRLDNPDISKLDRGVLVFLGLAG